MTEEMIKDLCTCMIICTSILSGVIIISKN